MPSVPLWFTSSSFALTRYKFLWQIAEIDIKYSGYLQRQQNQIDQVARQSNRQLSPNLDYHAIPTLSMEAREKLTKVKPLTLGQAARIGGVNPADINALLIYLELHNRQQSATLAKS